MSRGLAILVLAVLAVRQAAAWTKLGSNRVNTAVAYLIDRSVKWKHKHRQQQANVISTVNNTSQLGENRVGPEPKATNATALEAALHHAHSTSMKKKDALTCVKIEVKGTTVALVNHSIKFQAAELPKRFRIIRSVRPFNIYHVWLGAIVLLSILPMARAGGVALPTTGMVATQPSRQQPSASAGRAIVKDGTSQIWGDGHPWWKLDLQSQRTLSSVTIYNRDDCCDDRLDHFQIWVGYDRGSTSATSIMTVDCAGVGRFLYIMVPVSNIILTQRQPEQEQEQQEQELQQEQEHQQEQQQQQQQQQQQSAHLRP